MMNEMRAVAGQQTGGGRAARRRRRRRRVRSGNVASNGSTTMVSAPSAGSALVRRAAQVPRMLTSGEATRVCNTEMISAITNPLAFAQGDVYMHPAFFPWLKTVAAGFSKWRWIRLRFIYIPVCPTNTAGQLVLGLAYDVSDNAPTTSVQLQQAYKSVTSPVWAGFEGSALMNNMDARTQAFPGAVALDVDTARLGTPYYRFQSNTDILAMSLPEQDVFVPGRIFFAREGGVATPVTVGNLFAQYEVELIEPVAPEMNA